MMTFWLAIMLAVLNITQCKVYFKETFDGEIEWIYLTNKGGGAGKFKLITGKFHGGVGKDNGYRLSEDDKSYQILLKMNESFSNEGKTIILQYQVRHQQNINCADGYVKILSNDLTPETMVVNSSYYVMFGPDICGPDKKVHVALTYKGRPLSTKRYIRYKDDEMTHLYTLILKADNTHEVDIDGENEEIGELEADWDFLAPKKIKDPSAKKPKDWIDYAKMDDPDDKKPDDYDRPELIPDPVARKPVDWDDELDDEWERPWIKNPEYKGEWKPRQIKNPAYKGRWIHPEIDNPLYTPADTLYKFDNIGFMLVSKSGRTKAHLLLTILLRFFPA